MFLQKVEDLGCDLSGELFFREVFFVKKRLNSWQLVGNFRPLVINNLSEFAKSVDLFLNDVVVEHG